MDFGSKGGNKRRKNAKVDVRSGGYPHSLQFYSVPPQENISLQEFETYALDRLRVLKAVETIGIRHIKTTEEYKEALLKELRNLKTQGIMKALLKRNLKDDTNLTDEDLEDRKKDHISHFILRLAYCRSEELRRWFIAQELDIFRFRFMQEDDNSITEFLHLNKLDYDPISKEEKTEIMKELSAAAGNSSTPVDITHYYKVPFTDALDLVKSRRVFLKSGYAYVPHSELVVLILSAFRSHLSHALAVTCRMLPTLEEDDRLLPMLSTLSKRYLGQDYTNKKPTEGVITADMLDMLAKKSYPLCMSGIHKGIRETSHTRHVGRMQYGLFLKGIGLSLEEAMKFWRAAFSKQYDSEKFDKNYSYGIRHNYGKEGKRANYTPYSCVKIITTNHPSTGDHHGCPFKHTDVDLLRQRLSALGISKDGVGEVIDNVKSSNYQIACARYFEITHNAERGMYNFNHPNQYFEESQKLLNPKEGSSQPPSSGSGGGGGVIKTPHIPRSQSKTQSTPASGTQPDTQPDTQMDSMLTQEEMASLLDDEME